MPFHPFILLSGIAYMGFCLLAASVSVKSKRSGLETISQPPEAEARNHKKNNTFYNESKGNSFSQAPSQRLLATATIRILLPLLLSLSIFLCLPLGRLPAFLSIDITGLLALLLLIFPTVLLPVSQERRRHFWRVVIPLACALCACAWYARQRGVPGELFSLDTYVAMPLWDVVAWQGGIGLACLALGSGLSLYTAEDQLRSIGSDFQENYFFALACGLWNLAALGIWVSIFFPMGLWSLVKLEGLGAVAADALFFWGKILLLDYILFRVAQKKLKIFRYVVVLQCVLLLAGLGFLCMDP